MAFEHLSCNELKQWQENDVPHIVIDIRDQAAYRQGHIPSAKHIHNDNAQDFIENNNKSTPLIVCCYHGNSSQGAADFFNQQGFTRTYSLDGGYEAWRQIQP